MNKSESMGQLVPLTEDTDYYSKVIGNSKIATLQESGESFNVKIKAERKRGKYLDLEIQAMEEEIQKYRENCAGYEEEKKAKKAK